MADSPTIRWHRLLGALLDAVLSPVGVRVETDIPVTAESPRADILLLRREQPHWNEAQRRRLADGLRDTEASHLLIEFKYTEGLSDSAFVQLLSYDYFYRRHRRLPREDVACFLVSATTPRGDLLTRMGFHSRTVITGDITQIDLPGTRASGLVEALDILEGTKGFAFIRFTQRDVVRHPLVQDVVDQYARWEKKSRARGDGQS